MCEHLEMLEGKREPVRPSGDGCQECLGSGGRWVHLRLCLTCGHVGCCDSSPNRHATRHHHATSHPVIRSFQPGEAWAWCYVHEDSLDAVDVLPGEEPGQHQEPPGAGA